ncbi:hypothetical protein [Microbacterium oleivorans]|uniref:hypothetical protein n=1 Tax=Microbacterium oleivorans TaxID=273677 RepID=UPI0020414F95|nr:hypothetical protein [Microbacterium oleivorans]MCM3696897.1 hypothetical protein [Microbacterium oleivorans]
MGIITRYINKRVLDVWEGALGRLSVNQYESAAITRALESMEHLIDCRDAVDSARDAVRRADDDSKLTYNPTQYQQKQLFRVVSTFYDAFYSTVSAWSGVVSRFSDVFARTFPNNTAFLKWFDTTYPEQHDASLELERARAFRAMLAHPQSFPPYSFATRATQWDGGLAVVVHGPYARGQQKIPGGAQDAHPMLGTTGGWEFEAPDEVSVANCVSILAEGVLAAILSSRTAKSAFAKPITFDEAIELLEGDMDVSASARAWHRMSDLLEP